MKRFVLVAGGLLLFIVIVFGVLLFLASSRKSTVIADTSCDPPCWHHIQPGQTRPWEAVGILLGMQGVDQASIRQWGDYSTRGEIAWKFTHPLPDSAGYIYALDSRVAAISLKTFGALTLAQAFERLGEPESMWMRYKEIEWRHWLEIALAYPTRGFFVRVDIDLPTDTERASVVLTGDSPVARVIYFDPAQYEDLLGSRMLFKNEDKQTILDSLQPWQGLGVISYEHLLPDR